MFYEVSFYVSGKYVPVDYSDILEMYKSENGLYFHVRIDLLSGDYVFKLFVESGFLWSVPIHNISESLDAYRISICASTNSAI